jgi:hypothetical protein
MDQRDDVEGRGRLGLLGTMFVGMTVAVIAVAVVIVVVDLSNRPAGAAVPAEISAAQR